MVDAVKLDASSIKDLAHALSESFRRQGNNGGESSKSFFDDNSSRGSRATDFDDKKLFNKLRTLDKHIAKEMASTKAKEIKTLQKNINQKEKIAKTAAEKMVVAYLREELERKKKELTDKKSNKFQELKLKKQKEIWKQWQSDQKQSRENFIEGMTDTVDAFFTWKSAFALATTAATSAIGDFRSEIKHGTANTQTVLERMNYALAVGVDPEIMAELGAQNRASVIAMGGMGKWSEKLSDAQANLHKYVGDNAEIARITSDSFETMRMAGIEPTFEALKTTANGTKSLGNSFVQLQKMTGQTIAQSSAMMKSMMSIETVRMRLAATLDQTKRKAIMQEVVDRQKLLVKLGMMGEQAQKAAEALEAMAGEDPTERFKKAAHIQQLFGAMGMGAEGTRAAELERKGVQRTKEDDAEYASLLSKGAGEVAKRKTEGAGKGPEFFMAAMMKMPGMQERFGSNSPFVAALLGSDQTSRLENAAGQATVGEANVAATKAASVAALAANAAKNNPVVIAITAGLAAGGALGKILIASLFAAKAANVVRLAQLSTSGVFGAIAAATLAVVGTATTVWALTNDAAVDTAKSTDSLDSKTPDVKKEKKRITIGELEKIQKRRIAEDKASMAAGVFTGMRQKSLRAEAIHMKERGNAASGKQLHERNNFMKGITDEYANKSARGEKLEVNAIKENGLDTLAGIMKELNTHAKKQVTFADLQNKDTKLMSSILQDGVITADEAALILKKENLKKVQIPPSKT